MITILYWFAVLALFAGLIVWRNPSNKTAAFVCLIFFASLPPLVVFHISGFNAISSALQYHFALLVSAASFAVMPFIRVIRENIRGWRMVVLPLCVLMFGGYAAIQAFTLYKDMFLERPAVEGRVTDKRRVSARREPTKDTIWIGRSRVFLASSIASMVSIGDVVRAEVGQGTGFAYSLVIAPKR